MHDFLIGLADRPPFVALCVCVSRFTCFSCYMHGFHWFIRQATIIGYIGDFRLLCACFFDWLSRQATISCNMCSFFVFLVVSILYASFLLIDRLLAGSIGPPIEVKR